MGNGINPDHWWAKGAGAGDGAGQEPRAAGAADGRSSTSSPVCSTSTPPASASTRADGQHLLSGCRCQRAPSCTAASASTRCSPAISATNRPAEPGAGLRAADHRLPRDQFLDGLQLAHLLADADLAGADGGLSVAGVRQPVRQPRQPAQPQHPRSRQGCRPVRLSRQVSSSDRAKLDEYLTSVREVEKRAQDMRAAKAKADANAAGRGVPAAVMTRPDNGLPEDIREHMRLMCDIIALAFQTDKTRVATLLLCRDISGLFYPFLDVRPAHHPASHEDQSDAYERITRYYVRQFAYLVDKLAAMPEGERTVLDNSCLMFISNMWSGSKHDSRRCRCSSSAAWAGRSKRAASSTTHGGRREPQAVQPVPVADGSHGRDARPLRRRRHPAGRDLIAMTAGPLLDRVAGPQPLQRRGQRLVHDGRIDMAGVFGEHVAVVIALRLQHCRHALVGQHPVVQRRFISG